MEININVFGYLEFDSILFNTYDALIHQESCLQRFTEDVSKYKFHIFTSNYMYLLVNLCSV